MNGYVATLPAVSQDIKHVVRQRRFQVSSLAEIPGLLAALKAERFTGQVVIHISQGTVNGVACEEKAELNV